MTVTESGRFGLRSVAMLLCVYVWIGFAVGTAYGFVPIRPGVFFTLIPESIRAVVWGVTAVAGLLTCASRRWSALGLMLLIVMPLLSLVSYGLGWVMWRIPGGNEGFARGWYTAYFYLAAVGMVAVAALIPPRRRVVIVSGETEQEPPR